MPRPWRKAVEAAIAVRIPPQIGFTTYHTNWLESGSHIPVRIDRNFAALRGRFVDLHAILDQDSYSPALPTALDAFVAIFVQ